MRHCGHQQTFWLTLSDVALALTVPGHVTLSRRDREGLPDAVLAHINFGPRPARNCREDR
jgi:hypothetical protein